ncbi:MAG: radical SAM family heme chaperone HemW [Gammaproteobacteria bacterium]|nr:radical SAM family heme chaperone HemW [Gammaproteobacteria bacterium]
MTLLKEPPLSLYVHLPWCVKKCPYCDFNSHEFKKGELKDKEYVDALIKDLRFESPHLEKRKLSSIFFGGGTPSLFSPEVLHSFLSECRKELNFAEDIEISLEANPGAVDATFFQAYRELGVNRLSIGVQSFDDTSLSELGRIHNAEDALNAIETAHSAEFDNINIDIMFGLSGQSPAASLSDLKMAIVQKPEHLSWYQLNIEANTYFYSHPPDLPSEDEIWEMQNAGRELLEAAGYHQYEISAYARDGRESRHNLNYWRFGDYLGLGAGAHGKLTNKDRHIITRYAKHRIPDAYISRAGNESVLAESRIVERKELIFEFMLNALRLCEGFSESLFSARTGLQLCNIETALLRAREEDLIIDDNEQIRPTEKGQNYLNDLLQIFMPE